MKVTISRLGLLAALGWILSSSPLVAYEEETPPPPPPAFADPVDDKPPAPSRADRAPNPAEPSPSDLIEPPQAVPSDPVISRPVPGSNAPQRQGAAPQELEAYAPPSGGMDPLFSSPPRKLEPAPSSTAPYAAVCCQGVRPCCCDRPVWKARAAAVFMTREDPSAALLANGPGITIRGSDFSFDYEPGVDLSLSRCLDACSDLEVRYLGIDSWSDQTTANVGAGNFLIFTNPTSMFAEGASAVSARYDSHLYSAEALYKRRVSCDWSMGIGFRYLQIGDRLNLTHSGAALAADFDADNHLYGLQLGGQSVLWRQGRFSVDSFAKGGIYWNHVEASARVSGAANNFGASADDNLAFVGEIGLFGNYQLSRSWSLRAGYQALWVEGVSLAADQVSNTGSLGATPIPVGSDSGDLVYHGAYLGVEFVR